MSHRSELEVIFYVLFVCLRLLPCSNSLKLYRPTDMCRNLSMPLGEPLEAEVPEPVNTFSLGRNPLIALLTTDIPEAFHDYPASTPSRSNRATRRSKAIPMISTFRRPVSASKMRLLLCFEVSALKEIGSKRAIPVYDFATGSLRCLA